MRFLVSVVVLCAVAAIVKAQTPSWGFKIGSTGTDAGRYCKVAPNGNVYMTGYFSGTVDLDPGPGVNNVTSNGGLDIFLCCYSPAGAFLWGFSVGGTNSDGTYTLTCDASSNVIICGFIQSSGIDFDPGPGMSTIPFAGGIGAMTGDGFVAKYSSTGAFQWAKDLGGPTQYDYTDAVATDDLGCVYVGGTFSTTMVISPTITFSSAAAGPGYLIKYDAAGNLIWGHNFGQAGVAGVSTSVRSIVVKDGFMYTSGYLGGTSNFTPWTTPTIFTAAFGASAVDGYLAKYDTACNLIYVKQISGPTNWDTEASDLSMDAAGDLYLTGWTNSGTVVFNTASPATSTVSSPGGGGNLDLLMAKYSNSGVYQWGKVIGGPGRDFGWALDVAGSNVYISGEFSGTVDFDPSAAVANLVSSGGTDIYISKYDLSGSYLCGFRIGSSANDAGYSLTHDAAGAIYATGEFGGTGTDFDPSAATFPLSATGATDAYLVKYEYASATTITGYMAGDTICSGSAATLTVHTTAGGSGPFNVTYTDGTTTFTATGVSSGVPFAVIPAPLATTTYTLVSIVSAAPGLCAPPSGTGLGSATITVNSAPAAVTGNMPICTGATLTLSSATPAGTWSTGSAAIAMVSSSGVVTGVASGTATITYTTACGAVSAIVTVNGAPGPITGVAVVCAGTAFTVSNAIAGGSWSISNPAVATISSTGVVSTVSAGTATITYTTACGFVTADISVAASSATISGNMPLCSGASLALTGTAAGGTWTSFSPGVATVSSTGVVTGVALGTAVVSYVTVCGSATVVVTVTGLSTPITGNSPMCIGSTVSLANATAGGSWTISLASTATISPAGVVTGLAAGTAIVTYSTTCGVVTAVVTVNGPPAAISGNVPLCAGTAATLSSTSAGGTWSITPVTVATISASGIVTGAAAGTATATYTTACGIVTAMVTVNSLSSITGSVPLCEGAMIILSNAAGGGTWSVAPTTVATISAGGTVMGVSAGTAIATYTSSCGAVYTVLTVNSTPSVSAYANTPCEGGSLLLSATVPAGATVTWAGPSSFSASGPDVTISPVGFTNAGNYFVTASLGGCVSSPYAVVATVNPVPHISGLLSGNPTGCLSADGWIRLVGLEAGTSYTVGYLFNGVSATATITADAVGNVLLSGLASGVYSSIILTTGAGCASDSAGPVHIRFNALTPPAISSNQPLCAGETLTLSATAAEGASYVWAYPEGDAASGSTVARDSVQPPASGIYTLTYTVDTCSVTATTSVTVYPKTTLINITPNRIIQYGESVQLYVAGAVFYRWTGDGTITNPNINNPVVQPEESTVYTVYGMNEGGCPDTAEVMITVEDNMSEFIPTAFTPNGDGRNDVFRLRGIQFQKLIEFSVYNRWGERVYNNTYDKESGWDGTYNGVPQDMGVFHYLIIVGMRDKTQKTYKGDVTLIR